MSDITTADQLENLRQYNKWRRSDIDDMTHPKDIGVTLDWAIAEIERLRGITGVALITFDQIARTPRNRGAMRSAAATAMFLRTQMEQGK